MTNTIPFALFNSKISFNPYQYVPFFKVMEYCNDKERYCWNHKNLLIADEVGVGKTIEAGIIIRERLIREENLRVLIICPPKLCENWKQEMKTLFELSFDRYDIDKERMEFLGTFNGCINTQLSIFPITYFDKDHTEKMKYDVLIIDEIHRIRNRGKIYDKVKELIDENKDKMSIFMTATPIANSESDYEKIVELLGKDNYEFTTTTQGEANCYDYILKISSKKITYLEPEKEILREIYTLEKDGKYFRVNDHKKWVETRFEENYRPKYGKLTPWLKRISASSLMALKKYLENPNECEDDDELDDDELDDDDKEWMPNEREALKKLCEKNLGSGYEDRKLEKLKELIKSEMGESGKIVIFSCFILTGEYLENKLRDSTRDVFFISGKLSSKKVNELINKFEKSENQAILICTDVMKEGFNLQFCDRIIHYDLPYTPATLIQRNGRIYRKNAAFKDLKSFYLIDEDFYDCRLWGGIISEKCNVIRKYKNDRKVADIIVLPDDAKEYMNKCLEFYFEGEVAKQVDRIKRENSEKLESFDKEKERYNQGVKIFSMYLKKRFCMIGERGKLEGAQSLPDIVEKDITPDGIETAIKERYGSYDEVKFAYLHIVENKWKEEDYKDLFETYQENYKKQLAECIKKFWPEQDVRTDNVKEKFVELCDREVAPKTSLYCQDLMRESHTSYINYQEQFIPLQMKKEASYE